MRALILLISLTFSFNSAAVISNGSFDSSQFWGTWSWETSTHCEETYTFKPKGILQLKSGEELTDNEYQITQPEKAGQLATLNFKTIKDYGGIDCAGSTSDSSGQTAQMYIGISQDETKMLNCDTPDGQDCWLLNKIEDVK